MTDQLGPDLRHVTTWLFDLDDTLYPAETGLMAEIAERMTGFIMRTLSLPYAEAYRLQKEYLVEHGVTDSVPNAIFAYNHSQAYVQLVMSFASDYSRGGFSVSPITVANVPGCITGTGQTASKLGVETLVQNSVLYDGMSTLGGGATLVGIIIGSITVFMIDQKFVKAAAFAMAGAVLTFFGLMHSDAIGFAMTPKVAAAYLFVGVVLLLMAKYATVASKPAEIHHPHSMAGDESLA